ncbi:MAG: NPCBM/NEW2 domain-containing protein [Planctomycetota bacterium]
MRGSHALSALLLAALAAPALADENQIEALNGTYDERVQSIEGSGADLVVKTAARTLPLDTVKSIRFGRPSRVKEGQTKLVLTNGDWLRGAIEAGKRDQLGFKNEALGSLTIPLEQVRAVLPNAGSLEQERALEARLGPRSEVDWVLLENGGQVRGSVAQIDGAKVAINTDVEGGSNMGALEFDLIKVKLISITPLGERREEDPDALRVSLSLSDGSRLRGRPLSLDGKELVLSHPLGGKERKLGVSRMRIEQLSVENGRFAYLSDLEPAQVEQRFPSEYTYEVEVWGYKRDQNVTGGPLRLDGATFAKGLGVHSYCKLTYRLDKKFKTFRATVGLDDGVKYLGEPGLGGVIFRVLLDGKPAKELESGVRIKKGEKGRELTIDVSDAQTLTLVADFDPTYLHVLGRADWCDAHLIKR